MIISINWLKKFTDIDDTPQELAELIGTRLVEIEEVIDLGERYREVTTAKVMKVEDHPNADTLHIVQIDDGGVREDVERLDNGYVQVVCGAPNVREGLTVAWLPPGSHVPSSFTEKELFMLEARKLRGVMSNGMLASARELGFSDEHNGILEIDVEAEPGTSFAKLYDLDDYLLDIENKSLTHRPDCFGVVGFAREVAAIQGKQFVTPDWLQLLDPTVTTPAEPLQHPKVTIENPDICARYQAIALAGVDPNAHSPIWLQSYLSRSGVRPISALVDITNYLMMLTGQPLHAFDYDKLTQVSSTGKPDITVREGRDDETLALLDGREITLSSEDIVICAGDTPVALAGAMGGTSTEVDENTERILLESATFDLYRLRGTQMRHGIFSEAITRFTKGQSATQTAPVLAKAAELCADITGGRVASDIAEAYPKLHKSEELQVTLEKINGTLGTQLSLDDASAPLNHTEFTVENHSGALHVTAPYWRQDIHIPEDVIEEIGRIRGFDEITPTLPTRDFRAVRPTPFDEFRDNVRQKLVRAGANELLTYSFVHGDLMQKAGQDPSSAFRITNAISPDLQYYRLALTPSLLDKVHGNLKQRFENFALFEINKVHAREHTDPDEPDIPAEQYTLAAVLAADDKHAAGHTAYYHAKHLLHYALAQTGVTVTFTPLETQDHHAAQSFEPKRSAAVYIGDDMVGVTGEYTRQVARNFKLPAYAAGFEVALDRIFAATSAQHSYQPISRFPGTHQDICMQVSPQTPYADVENTARRALADETREWHIEPVDIYQPETGEYKNITLRISLTDHTRTITTDEASVVVAYIAEAMREKLGAEII